MSNLDFDQYGQPKADKNLPIVIFSNEAIHLPDVSLKEGRPVYRDMEVVTIAFPADRQRTLVRPANSVWKKVDGRPITYIERFAEQYKRFKADQPQIVEGTPISEAPFLTVAQRATLKALQVYTVEQLASLSGQALKNVGPGGLGLQQAAETYLANAKGSANVTALASENARLKETLAQMGAQGTDPRLKFAEMGDDKLREFIKDKTGENPRGNPSRATLMRMCVEVDRGAPAQTSAEAA